MGTGSRPVRGGSSGLDVVVHGGGPGRVQARRSAIVCWMLSGQRKVRGVNRVSRRMVEMKGVRGYD
jgi:hypothetical protein